MRKIRNMVLGGLQQKIFNLVLFTIIIIMTFYTILAVYQIRRIQGLLEESSDEQQASSQEPPTRSCSRQRRKR